MKRNVAAEIRALIQSHGPMTAAEITALLPKTETDNGPVRITGRQVSGRLKPMQASGMLKREGDRYHLVRQATQYSPELARERARKRASDYYHRQRAKAGAVVKPMRRTTTMTDAMLARRRDFANRREANACAAQELNRKHLGLRDMPANEPAPCTETWLAQHRNDPRRFQQLRNGDVSPASRFQRIEVSA